MPLSVRNPETEALARELVALTGETITGAITEALRQRLARERRRRATTRAALLARVTRLRERVARWPVLDDRPADDILGYDEHGVPR
jgi:antitoxin VapB